MNEDQKRNLEEGVKGYYDNEYAYAEKMEFRHGDYYKDSSFVYEKECDYYKIVIEQMAKMINHPLYFHSSGVYKEHDQIRIVNPDFKINSDVSVEHYHVYAEVSVVNGKWMIKYQEFLLEFENVTIE